MSIYKFFLLIFVSLLLTGCTYRTIEYTEPNHADINKTTSILIHKSKDLIWRDLIQSLGKNHYNIAKMDKASGFIRVDYSGAPETYVDCGTLTLWIETPDSKKKHSEFPAAQSKKYRRGAYNFSRKTGLSAKMNIIIEEYGPNSCLVSAKATYTLRKKVEVLTSGKQKPTIFDDTISFYSGQAGYLDDMTCQPNGYLESSVLSLAR